MVPAYFTKGALPLMKTKAKLKIFRWGGETPRFQAHFLKKIKIKPVTAEKKRPANFFAGRFMCYLVGKVSVKIVPCGWLSATVSTQLVSFAICVAIARPKPVPNTVPRTSALR